MFGRLLLFAFSILIYNQGLEAVEISIAKNEVCPKRVVGYHNRLSALPLTDNQAAKLTHISYAHVDATGGLGVSSPIMAKSAAAVFKTLANIEGNFGIAPKSPGDRNRLWSMRKKARDTNDKVKMMFTFGGRRMEKEGQRISDLIKDADKRAELISSIMKFMMRFRLSGVDIDWRYPGEADKQNYVTFLHELRSEFNNFQLWSNPLSISITVPGQLDLLALGYNLEALAPHVDFVNVLLYNKKPEKETFASGLLSGVNHELYPVMKYIACKIGVNKLNLGISLSANSEAGTALAKDEEDGIKEKVAHARQYGIGGVVIWPSDVDDSSAENLFNLAAAAGNGESCVATSTYQCNETEASTTPVPPLKLGKCVDCRGCKPDGTGCHNCCVSAKDGRGDKAGCTNCRYCSQQGPCTNCCAGAQSGCNNCVKEYLGNCCP